VERIASRPPLFQNRDRSARFCGGVLDPVPTAVAFIPPFAKSAKDGAPEDLWLVESGRVGYRPAAAHRPVICSSFSG